MLYCVRIAALMKLEQRIQADAMLQRSRRNDTREKRVQHDPASIPEERRWIQGGEVEDIGCPIYGIGGYVLQRETCKLILNARRKPASKTLAYLVVLQRLSSIWSESYFQIHIFLMWVYRKKGRCFLELVPKILKAGCLYK